MPLGPELITSAEDRNFTTSLGNWLLFGTEPEWTFSQATDPLGQRNGCARFNNLSEFLGSANAYLSKDYFDPFIIGEQYLMKFWGQIENSPDIISIGFNIRDSIGHRWGISVNKPEVGAWYQKQSYWTVPANFQNTTRELRFYATDWYPGHKMYANGLSIKKVITAKTDHLAIMGVH